MIPGQKAVRPTGGVSFCSGAFCLLGMVAQLLFLSTPPAHGATISQADMKAAYLYNFAKFVEWPAEAFSSETARIQLGVFGDDEFAVKLKSLLSDKQAHGRSFEVKTFSSPQEAKNFQMVFIAGAETRRTLQILEAARKSPVLTIGESEQFLDTGGMINFVIEDTQLRFEVNPEAAQNVKMEISSKLLRLARKRSPK